MRAAALRPCFTGLLLVGVFGAAAAQGLRGPGTAAQLPSCVSDARLELGAADERALLDDTDRAALGSAMLQRYPMLARDGFAPAAILMWRKPGGEWLYVAIAGNGRSQAGWCFTASFNANVFDITPALLRKYFFQGAGRA
jgi:hypothetical protein